MAKQIYLAEEKTRLLLRAMETAKKNRNERGPGGRKHVKLCA